MNEKRKQFVSLALALTMTAGLLGSMSGCDKTEPSGSGPAVVDTKKSPVVPSTEETQGVSEVFPGLDFSEKKGSPVLSDVIWLNDNPRKLKVGSGQLFIEELSNGTARLRDYSGNLVGEYDDVNGFSEGLAAVQKGGKWGYIDTEGQLVISPEYDGANNFSEGLACVQKDGKWGCIDTKGQVVIPLEYDSAQFVFENLVMVYDGTYVSLIDNQGNVVFEPGSVIGMTYLSGNFAIAVENEKIGYIDADGNYVIPAEYDVGYHFYDGFAAVEKDGKWGVVNTQGKVVVPLEYDAVNSFIVDGLACVSRDGKYGFVDTEGNIVISFEYDMAYSFSEGLARVKKDGKWGYIGTDGQVVIPLEYSRVDDFFKGFALVEKDGKWGCIDTKGQFVFPPEYQEVRYRVVLLPQGKADVFYNGLAIVKKDGKWGVIDKNNQLVLPLEYDMCNIANDGDLIFVKKGESWGFCTVTWP